MPACEAPVPSQRRYVAIMTAMQVFQLTIGVEAKCQRAASIAGG